ncbi:MAG: hypothetical protein ACOCZ8_05045 [Bacteroidota bacterium]
MNKKLQELISIYESGKSHPQDIDGGLAALKASEVDPGLALKTLKEAEDISFADAKHLFSVSKAWSAHIQNAFPLVDEIEQIMGGRQEETSA